MSKVESHVNDAAQGRPLSLNQLLRLPLARVVCLLALALSAGAAAQAQTVTGAGTPDHLPKFSGLTSLNDSILKQSGGRIEIGYGPDAAFAVEQSSGTPNAGFFRFGDSTGWKLHFGRSREYSAGPLNTGTRGVVMTIQDNGNVGIGTRSPTARLHVNGDSFISSLYVGGQLNVGGGCYGCSPPSDRNLKTNFAAVSPRFILERLASLPVQTWSYKSEPASVRHIGVMAQDFRATFNLGADDKTLSVVDAHGVTMAAIQGLHQLSLEQQARIADQQEQLKRQRQEIDALKSLVCQSSRHADLCVKK
jgi:Chaperone of endosialidase